MFNIQTLREHMWYDQSINSLPLTLIRLVSVLVLIFVVPDLKKNFAFEAGKTQNQWPCKSHSKREHTVCETEQSTSLQSPMKYCFWPHARFENFVFAQSAIFDKLEQCLFARLAHLQKTGQQRKSWKLLPQEKNRGWHWPCWTSLSLQQPSSQPWPGCLMRSSETWWQQSQILPRWPTLPSMWQGRQGRDGQLR